MSAQHFTFEPASWAPLGNREVLARLRGMMRDERATRQSGPVTRRVPAFIVQLWKTSLYRSEVAAAPLGCAALQGH